MSQLVAGEVPGLPSPDGTFDGMLANFVLSHFTRYETALFDMVRVLWPAGGQARFAKEGSLRPVATARPRLWHS